MPKNKNSYWAERARKDKLKVIKTGEQGIDNLKRLLLLNIKDVERQIKDFYEKYGENPAEELSNKNWQQYKKRLRDMAKANPQDKTLQKLAKQNIPKYKIDRLRALELDLQMQLTEATNGQAKGIYNTLDDVSKVSQATLASRMNKTLGLTFNAISANKMKQILMSDWSGANWSERLWKDREKVGKKLTEVLEKGIPQGVSLQKMSRELRDLTGESFNNAFRLIRTETSHIDGQVTLEGYRQASEELGLQYYEYDAFLDSRTSSFCRELDGKRFKITDAEVGVNYPPRHPNCRSTTQLVLDEDYKQEETPKEDIKSNKNAITPEILAKPYEDISQNDKLIQELKEHTKTLDDATKKSIQKYTTGWEGEYLKVNGILRGNLKEYEGLTGVMTEDKIKQAKEWINDIDKAMDKSPLPQNMKLYRGISHDGIKAIFKNDEIANFIEKNEVNENNLIKIKDTLLNARYDELGYMSTSYAKTSAYKSKTRFTVNAPQNLKGILVEDIGIGDEHEMLLERNTSWKIKDITVDFDVIDRIHYYNFELDYLSS